MENEDIEKRSNLHYKKKAEWHKENTPVMSKIFNEKCQECGSDANSKIGVIHHRQYTGNDYEKPLEKLLADNAIEWLCKNCHKKKHVALNREEVDLRIKHSGFCAICNEFSWHAWFKLNKGVTHGRGSFPICNKCLDFLLSKEVMKEFWFDNHGYKSRIIRWGNIEQFQKEQRIIFKNLIPKIKRETFGDLSLLKNDSSNQGKLF
ncbi:MAG: HNH endonuclease [Saprospiraceae bacterium]|nr:HNH endonuclease [Saprospiraceae bacterium]MCB9326286.1 HNH endonuclease [Lewinellaceae bacterium]